jgi:hypothetical protein
MCVVLVTKMCVFSVHGSSFIEFLFSFIDQYVLNLEPVCPGPVHSTYATYLKLEDVTNA